jgi:hypothetical protein
MTPQFMQTGQYVQNTQGQTAYWANVNQTLISTPGFFDENRQLKELVYITSLSKPMRGITGGRVFGATPKLAAQRIVEETHRLSTPEEVEAEAKRVEAEGRRLFHQEEERKTSLRMKSTPEDDQRMAGIVAAAVSSVVNSKSKGGTN